MNEQKVSMEWYLLAGCGGVYQPIVRPLGALYSLWLRSDFNTIKTVKTPRGGQLWRECAKIYQKKWSALMLSIATGRLWSCKFRCVSPFNSIKYLLARAPERQLGAGQTPRRDALYFLCLLGQLFPLFSWKVDLLTFSEWHGTRGKTADQTDERSTLQLITSIVIHQSKAIILPLMKFQFAFSAFHVDIFHIATVLW